jgi:hypothetical protein
VKLRPPSPSFVVAAVALSLALGGGVGYAAGQLPKNSVGSKQIKKNAVTTAKIRTGAVMSAQLADGTVAGPDLAAGAVTGPKVAPNSLTGTQIDESTLVIPTKPTSLFLTGTDFLPLESASTFLSTGSGEVYSASGGTFSANLHLPPGAAVTGLKLFYVDNGGSTIEFTFGRFSPAMGDASYEPVSNSEGAVAAMRTMTLTPAALPAGSVGVLRVYLPAGSTYKIVGAQIDYQ